MLVGREAWVAVHSGDAVQTLVDWVDGQHRGVYSRLYELGRVRKSAALDRATPPLALQDYSLSTLEHAFAGATPRLEAKDKDRTLVTHYVIHIAPLTRARILVDTQRHVVPQC